jgi:anti-sigma-K factor RskA
MGAELIHDLAAPYALGALDADERRRFEEHLATCERCRAELAELQGAAAALAFAGDDASPPPQLRERILEQARSEGGVVIPFRRRRAERVLALVAIPAAAAAVGLGVWAGTLHGRLGNATAVADVLNDPSAQTVALRGSDGTLVVSHTRKGVLVLNDLAAARAGNTYEAWVIEGGKPRPAGLFDRGGVVLLSRPVPRDATVALTVEPAGGSDEPSGKPFASATT